MSNLWGLSEICNILGLAETQKVVACTESQDSRGAEPDGAGEILTELARKWSCRRASASCRAVTSELPLLRVVNHRGVMDLIAAGAQVIDVLPAHEYRACHIRGAIHLPLARVMREAKGLLRPDRSVLVYCRDSL